MFLKGDKSILYASTGNRKSVFGDLRESVCPHEYQRAMVGVFLTDHHVCFRARVSN